MTITETIQMARDHLYEMDNVDSYCNILAAGIRKAQSPPELNMFLRYLELDLRDSQMLREDTGLPDFTPRTHCIFCASSHIREDGSTLWEPNSLSAKEHSFTGKRLLIKSIQDSEIASTKQSNIDRRNQVLANLLNSLVSIKSVLVWQNSHHDG